MSHQSGGNQVAYIESIHSELKVTSLRYGSSAHQAAKSMFLFEGRLERNENKERKKAFWWNLEIKNNCTGNDIRDIDVIFALAIEIRRGGESSFIW